MVRLLECIHAEASNGNETGLGKSRAELLGPAGLTTIGPGRGRYGPTRTSVSQSGNCLLSPSHAAPKRRPDAGTTAPGGQAGKDDIEAWREK